MTPKNRLQKILNSIEIERGDVALLSISDVHLRNDCSYGTYNEDGVNSDLIDKFNILNEALDVATKLRIPFICLGDLLDSRVVDAITLAYAAKFLSKLRVRSTIEGKIPYFIILGGNHEFDDYAAKFSSLSQYQWLIDHQFVLEYNRIIRNNIRFTCFPATKNVEECIKSHKHRKYDKGFDVALFHGPIRGADYGHAIAGGGIPAELIQGLADTHDWVLCGDFHKYQFVNGSTNIVYSGSVKQMNVGDAGDRRGYQVLNLTKSKMNFIESLAPKFKIIDIVHGEKTKTSKIAYYPEKYLKVVKGNIIVIRISGTSEEVYAVDFDKIKENLLACGAVNVYKETEIHRTKRNSVKIDKTLPLKSIIRKYVDNRSYNEKLKLRKELVKVGEKYVK